MKELLERTSVRDYTGQPIEEEKVQAILKAAFAAPSAKDSRPWEFIVVKNKDTLQKMSEVSPNAYMLKEAAMGIVVLAKPVDTEVEYAMQDCAAATQNMLIAAKELGIGSCWIGCTPRMERVEKLRNIFPSIPQDVYPFWMIAFGYPKSDRGVKDKWDETKIHVETY